MKKLTALLLSSIMVLGLAACGSSQSSTAVTTTENTEAETESTEEVTTEDTEAENTEEASTESTEAFADTTDTAAGDKVLVVYYSASGHTRSVAGDIAEALGADTFELVPQTPYTDEDLDWTTDGSRVNNEHDDESLRDIPLVSDTVDNWNEYSTVFIGYPIWWGIAAWPVNEFVKNNDFTGKTVIPFATSASSGMGESGSLLAEMAGTGDWQEGQRFSSGASSDEVTEWANGLGIN